MKSLRKLSFENVKGGFFSESAICFSNLQQKVFQKTNLNLKFKFPANNSMLKLAENFKSRIVFWNIFFWRFGGLKNTSHFLKKKPPLVYWKFNFQMQLHKDFDTIVLQRGENLTFHSIKWLQWSVNLENGERCYAIWHVIPFRILAVASRSFPIIHTY